MSKKPSHEALFINCLTEKTSVNENFRICIPSHFKSVKDLNAFIQGIGEKAQYIEQREIDYFYKKWSPEDQAKFIWKDGQKPEYNNHQPVI